MEREQNGKAVASLVFGILGLTQVCPCIGSLLALVLGWGEPGDLARVGRILGWLGLAIQALALLLFFLGLIGSAIFWLFAAAF